MRTIATLLVLAAAIQAAERQSLTLEELGRVRNSDSFIPADHLFLLRAGVQSLVGDVQLQMNGFPEQLDERRGNRQHLDGLVLVQPFEMRPGLLLGVGASHSYWNLGDNAGMNSLFADVLGGLEMPLSSDNSWRVEALGYLGTGQASIGENAFNTATSERGVDLNLIFPLSRAWHLEGGLSVGWYWSSCESALMTVVKAGTTFPVTVDLDAKAMAYGFSLTWRP